MAKEIAGVIGCTCCTSSSNRRARRGALPPDNDQRFAVCQLRELAEEIRGEPPRVVGYNINADIFDSKAMMGALDPL